MFTGHEMIYHHIIFSFLLNSEYLALKQLVDQLRIRQRAIRGERDVSNVYRLTTCVTLS